jgi:hypothetical protein
VPRGFDCMHVQQAYGGESSSYGSTDAQRFSLVNAQPRSRGSSTTSALSLAKSFPCSQKTIAWKDSCLVNCVRLSFCITPYHIDIRSFAVYAIVTELPAIFLLYNSAQWSAAFLLLIFSVSVWNGGGFYIEVFGRK